MNPNDGNLIHLNGPSLIPGKLIDDFRASIMGSPAPEDTRIRCLLRFEEALNENPAYLWESDGQSLSFFIYKEQERRIDLLWCHQIEELFPAMLYFMPAAKAFFEATKEDLQAQRITSQFSSWSSVIGIDLPSMAFPELGFRRFDVEIMNCHFENAQELKNTDLLDGFACVDWNANRLMEAAELMASVGDSYMKYVGMTPKECLETISKICDPELSWMIFNRNDSVVAFITSNKKGWIGQLFTREDYQRQGMGRYLLTLAMRTHLQQRTENFSLAMLSDNERARRLYESADFTTSSNSVIWAWLANGE